jgi:hypothetical protein
VQRTRRKVLLSPRIFKKFQQWAGPRSSEKPPVRNALTVPTEASKFSLLAQNLTPNHTGASKPSEAQILKTDLINVLL